MRKELFQPRLQNSTLKLKDIHFFSSGCVPSFEYSKICGYENYQGSGESVFLIHQNNRKTAFKGERG